MTVLTQGRNFLLALGIIYVVLLLGLMHPVIQRELFYLNSVKFPWLVDTSKPETCGFAPSRVQSFFLPNKVHAWHIKPLDHYRTGKEANIDPSTSKLVIYFHGTAGTLAIPHRLTTYRVLSALPNVHVLTLDYRGFGISEGQPSEAGLIDDGISAVLWALDQGFHPSQITLFGQSLGSAVALAVAHNLSLEVPDNQRVQVGHVVTVAAFYTASEVVKTYRVGGYIPILSPMRTYPVLQRWLVERLHHKWDSAARIQRLAAETNIKLTLAHALSDTEILAANSERLFMDAVRSRGNASVSTNGKIDLHTLPLRDGGRVAQAEPPMDITYLELAWGAHNLVQWNDEILSRL